MPELPPSPKKGNNASTKETTVPPPAAIEKAATKPVAVPEEDGKEKLLLLALVSAHVNDDKFAGDEDANAKAIATSNARSWKDEVVDTQKMVPVLVVLFFLLLCSSLCFDSYFFFRGMWPRPSRPIQWQSRTTAKSPTTRCVFLVCLVWRACQTIFFVETG
jgi:hypothetical protein